MKIKKSNIVLICLIAVFFINSTVNFYIVIKKHMEFIQTRKERVIEERVIKERVIKERVIIPAEN